MIIPEIKVEEVRSSVNVVDIVSEYVQLKKRGRNYVGLCPFHQEKTPSFIVSDEKQIYHCFGCHAGGNVFKFLMEIDNISFVEAVQELARRQGIALEAEESVSNEQQNEIELLFDINTFAAKFFLNNLHQTIQGEIAREYFSERKIKVPAQRSFGLGYALPDWESFVKHAIENKIDLTRAQQLGLIEKKENRYYDKFRGRVIFPIFSPNGRVIAFGGRIMEKNVNAAKYLNSPESPVYSKRKSLYGLYHSKEEIRRLDKVILVEGYMDLISLFQNGVKNVVASSGTALTEEQVIMLSRYTKNIVVFYDADPAGIKASLRSIELLVKRDFDVKIAELPQGEDPDSFINNYGKQEFDELIKKAQNFLEYQTGQYEKEGKFNDPVLQTEAIRQLVQSASFVNDELKRNLLIKSISKKFNLREKLIESELDKFLKQGPVQKPDMKLRNDNGSGNSTVSNRITLDTSIKICPSEKDILKLLFEGDLKIIEFVFNNIMPEEFRNPDHQQLAHLVYESFTAGESISPSALIEKIEDENLRNFVLKIAFEKHTISKTWEDYNPGLPSGESLIKIAKDSIRKFKLFLIDEELSDIHNKIKSALTDEEVINLMHEKQKLLGEKKLIQNSSE